MTPTDSPAADGRGRDRVSRVAVANAFLRIISEHGRRFFHYEGRVAQFVVDARGRVWFVNEWNAAVIYTHRDGSWGRHFHHGGTLLALCKALRDYVMGRRGLPLNHLGPWPDWVCAGDLWGYGADMAAVRERCGELARTAANQ